MAAIRQAEEKDVSRIAEILVFAKRTAYRSIFHNDLVSFGEIQVCPLARELLAAPETFREIWVYDDAFVKGMARVRGDEIKELYVEPFFQGQGVGGCLLDYATGTLQARWLWVLEKNAPAIGFYQSHGFVKTRERIPEDGTPEYLIRMEKRETP